MPPDNFKHTMLSRLDASIDQFEDTLKELTNDLADTQMRKRRFTLLQVRKEMLSVRDEAIATLTRLNTFGATLDTMANPEAGVDAVLTDVLKWFLLLSECDRAFISLYDADTDEFTLMIDKGWIEEEKRPTEQTISESVLAEAKQSLDIFLSSNMDMATESYQKSGSWRMPLRAVLGIPLLWNDQLIGAFYGDRKITSGTLSRDMMPLFKLYAAQAAIAIRNAQLFAKLSKS